MADVQYEHGFTKLADVILEAIAKAPLNGSQFRILSLIWRQTYGYNRKEHDLSAGFIATGTNLDPRNVRKELKKLQEMNVIFQRGKSGETRVIGFNKDYEKWSFNLGSNDPRVDQPQGESALGGEGQSALAPRVNSPSKEIQSLNTDLNTEEEEEDAETILLTKSIEIEKHYCQKRGIRDASTADFQEIKKLVADNIPVEFIKTSIDRSFAEYKPKHKRDEIRTFSYLSLAVYDRWSKHLEKVKPFPLGGQADAAKPETRGIYPAAEHHASHAASAAGGNKGVANLGNAQQNTQPDFWDQFVHR